MSAYIVLDAGTGGGKSAIFDASGRRLAVQHRPWRYDVHVDPSVPFAKELSFDPSGFWSSLCDSTRAAVRDAGIAPREIAGIATTSQRQGCVFLDAAGQEVYAGPNVDTRAFREGLEVLERLGSARLHHITGHSAPFIFPLARYLWFRTHGAAIVAHLLMISDWLTYRLSGELCAEPSNATESMLFDLTHRCWSDEILRTFDVPATILPPLRQAGERVGRLTAAAATALGLQPGTPVFVGGADTQCSLLGAGALEPGATAATFGTTTPVQTVLGQALFDPAAELWSGCHVLRDRWVVESNAGDTGEAYLWLLDLLSGGASREQALAMAEPLAAEVMGPPVMMFTGPTVFNLTKVRLNRPGGVLFPFPAFHERPKRGRLIRAFLESVAYAVRANLEQLVAVTGQEPAEMFASGGMTRSSVLTQTVADVIGRPVRVAVEPDSAALGCALMMIATDTGQRSDELAHGIVRHTTVDPSPARVAAYDRAYRTWRRLYDAMDDLEVY